MLNMVGFTVSLAGSLIVAKALNKWQGILREGIFFFLCGFFLLSLGFLWSAMYPIGALAHNGDLGFFAAGAIFSLLGANKIFSLKKPA